MPVVNPGIRRFLASAIQRLFNGASFYAPLTHSLVPTRGTGSPTFTRATTATVRDNEGVLRTAIAGESRFEGARRVRNLLTNTGWAGAVTGTPGTPPTGWTADVGTGALTVASNATYTNHNQITFTATAQRPFIRLSVAVAAYSTYLLNVVVVDNASGEPINDIIAGSSVPAGATESYLIDGVVVAASAVPVAGDVIQYKVAVAATAGTINWRVGLGCQGAATGSVTVVAPQLEDITGRADQTTPSEYVSVGVLSAPYHGAGVDGVKYFNTDLDGNLIAASINTGYVAEGARTNLCLQSNAFTTTWGTISAPTIAQNSIGPDGGTTAWTITDDSGVASEGIAQAILLTAAAHTLSVFVKKTTGAQASYPVVYAASATHIAPMTIDTSNGVATAWSAYTGFTIASGLSASCVSYNDDFWRCSVTFTASAANWSPSLIPAGTTNATQSTGTLDLTAQGSAVFYGAQVELGSFATPYIPTTTLAVARNADVDQYPTTAGPIAAAGAISLDFTPYHAPSGTIALWGTYVDASNYTAILHDATNLIFRKRIAGSNYDATIANAFVSGTTCKIAATWGAAGTAIYLDGVAGTPHANTTAAQIAATMQVGADGNSLQQPGAGTTNLRIWQRQLSSPEGVAVTA